MPSYYTKTLKKAKQNEGKYHESITRAMHPQNHLAKANRH